MAGHERSPHQEYVATRSGRRIAAHTPRLRGGCACQSCKLRRYWTPERRAERSEALRRLYAEGRRTKRRNPNAGRRSVWQRSEDDLLRALVGRHDLATIARKLAEATGWPRTKDAVKHRIGHLGLSQIASRPFSSTEVGRMLGISRETVRTRLVDRGLLTGERRTGGPHGMRLFERAELERLVAEHPECFDFALIRDRALRMLAVAARRTRPSLTSAEVMRRTGAEQRELCSWYTSGLVPSARKILGLRGHGGGWLIGAGDLGRVRELVAASRARRARRAIACEAGHPWTVPFSPIRRCPTCSRLKRKPLRSSPRFVDRAAAIARVVGRVRYAG